VCLGELRECLQHARAARVVEGPASEAEVLDDAVYVARGGGGGAAGLDEGDGEALQLLDQEVVVGRVGGALGLGARSLVGDDALRASLGGDGCRADLKASRGGDEARWLCRARKGQAGVGANGGGTGGRFPLVGR
jgi:hypothetical protein